MVSRSSNYYNLTRSAAEIGSRSEPGEDATGGGTFTRRAAHGDLSRRAGEVDVELTHWIPPAILVR